MTQKHYSLSYFSRLPLISAKVLNRHLPRGILKPLRESGAGVTAISSVLLKKSSFPHPVVSAVSLKTLHLERTVLRNLAKATSPWRRQSV